MRRLNRQLIDHLEGFDLWQRDEGPPLQQLLLGSRMKRAGGRLQEGLRIGRRVRLGMSLDHRRQHLLTLIDIGAFAQHRADIGRVELVLSGKTFQRHDRRAFAQSRRLVHIAQFKVEFGRVGRHAPLAAAVQCALGSLIEPQI